jgi:hypothetical protein
MTLAFRCKSCGHLHHAEHAGDNVLPHSCLVCGRGVRHGPDFENIAARLIKPDLSAEERKELAAEIAAAQNNLTKTLQPDNWEVLADCTPEQLKDYGLAPEHVCRHVPEKPPDGAQPRTGKAIFIDASETFGIKDSAKAN